jgi:hypothetical protein
MEEREEGDEREERDGTELTYAVFYSLSTLSSPSSLSSILLFLNDIRLYNTGVYFLESNEETVQHRVIAVEANNPVNEADAPQARAVSIRLRLRSLMS